MARSVEKLDGLAALGTGTFGPISIQLPGLLFARGDLPSDPPERPVALRSGSADSPGERRLLLTQHDGRELRLDLTIPAPEIAGVPGSFSRPGPGVVALHWPLPPAAWAEIRAGPSTDLILIGNGRTLWAEGEPFVRAIADIRRELGGAPLLWSPRTALPHRLALLAYLSVDLTDTTLGLWRAAEGEYLDSTLGALDVASARRERRCRCAGCFGSAPSLALHALEAYGYEMTLLRAALRSGRLRELVEIRQGAEPAVTEMLRYADRLLADRLEEGTSLLGAGIRSYILRESFRRPEVARFRRRFLERYRPPPSKRVLLLVPCSKTKPYRNSRSHRRFAQAFAETPRSERVHVVSVTSPLGVVPREIEDLPPARHYDIPVTGEWDESEREAVVAAVSHLIRVGAYRSIVVHLDPKEYAFLRVAIPDSVSSVWTMTEDRSTSPEALGALKEAVTTAVGELTHVPGGPLQVVREELQSLAAVQFGQGAAAALFGPDIRLHGRPWSQRVTDGTGRDLATWQETRGLFHLTVAGADRMGSAYPLRVEVDPSVTLQGDLFTAGVRQADPAIRSGDAVVLTRAGTILGVGEADLPGPLMTALPRGRAVEVRHRRHAAAASPPTPT
ncbi:MAG: DUF5591 domain-containing protein [Thermoplasmata archaeon]